MDQLPAPSAGEHVWMLGAKVSVTRRYAVAIGCVLSALAFRYFLTPLVGDELPFLGFVAAALAAASYGGAMAGVVALLLGLLFADFFILPTKGGIGWYYPADKVAYIRYISTASVGIILIEIMHRGRLRVERVAAELRREIGRREQSEHALLEAKGQISAHAAELETRVTERTAKLKETLDSLQNVLYHIAHDLRAPLRAMRGFTDALISDYGPKLDAEGKDFAKRVGAAAERMDMLIQDLLDYGRLGHLDLALSPLDLDQAMRNAESRLSQVIKAKEAKIEIQGPLPWALAHATMLDRVLVNLLDNAVKFVAPGVKPHIRIRAETLIVDDTAWVKLWIQDNGIGVAPEHHERIFRVFERLHDQATFEGTGIGLAIVSQGMQKMKGRAGVESDGNGSLFWIELQAAPGEQ
jgi:signal transduction histidine kinase